MENLCPDHSYTFSQFQQECLDFSTHLNKDFSLLYFSNALCGEAGEVANETKKMERDDHNLLTPERKEKLLNELANTLYYLSRMTSKLQVSLSDLAKRQITLCQTKRTCKTAYCIKGYNHNGPCELI